MPCPKDKNTQKEQPKDEYQIIEEVFSKFADSIIKELTE